MEARISIIVIMLMIFVSNVGEAVFGQQMYQTVTENFVVNAPDPQLARRAATLAEGYRASLSHCLLYTSPSPRDQRGSRMPSSA